MSRFPSVVRGINRFEEYETRYDDNGDDDDDDADLFPPGYNESSVFFEAMPEPIVVNSARLSGNRTLEVLNADAASCFQLYHSHKTSKTQLRQRPRLLPGHDFNVAKVQPLRFSGEFVNKRPVPSDETISDQIEITLKGNFVPYNFSNDDFNGMDEPPVEPLTQPQDLVPPTSPINSASGWVMTPEQRRLYQEANKSFYEYENQLPVNIMRNVIDNSSGFDANIDDHLFFQSPMSSHHDPSYSTNGEVLKRNITEDSPPDYLDYDVDFIKAEISTINIPKLSQNWKMSSQYCPLKFKGKDLLIPLTYSPYNIFIFNSGPATKQYILDWMAANRRPRIGSSNKGVIFKTTFDLSASKLVELIKGMGINTVIIALAGMKTPMYNVIDGILPIITRQRDNCYDISHVYNTDGIVLLRNIRSHKTKGYKATVFPMLFQLGRVGEENYGSITLRCSDGDARIPFIRIYQTLFHYVETSIHSFNVCQGILIT